MIENQPRRAENVKPAAKGGGRPAYGRGTGVPDPIDVEVGARIRTRRLLIGMNQEQLAKALGLTFQQVQKYEGGANRVSASRLSQIAQILDVPISYFFTDLDGVSTPANPQESAARERLLRPETIELVRAYYGIHDARARHQFLDMIKAVAESRGPSH